MELLLRTLGCEKNSEKNTLRSRGGKREARRYELPRGAIGEYMGPENHEVDGHWKEGRKTLFPKNVAPQLDGDDSLRRALKSVRLDVVQRLLDCGADVKETGQTTLDCVGLQHWGTGTSKLRGH